MTYIANIVACLWRLLLETCGDALAAWLWRRTR